MANILLVEDEPDLAKLLSDCLLRGEHLLDVVSNGDDAMSLLRANKSRYELLILDIMLPGRNGIEVCKSYRNSEGMAPILMLTARDSIEDKELAFQVGADDYLTKPFHLKELLARVGALLRRGVVRTSKNFAVRDVVLDPVERKVTKDGEIVHLSPKEFHLLEFLMRHPNQIFSSDELIQNVWEPCSDAMNDTVRGHINRLRRKLDTDGLPSLIANVYGFGYKLETTY